MKRFLATLWETLEVAIVAIVTVLIIRTFIVQPFLVSGASMEPNFSTGDYLIIDEMTYRFRPPERGDIVVFRYLDEKNTFFIKRVIGLPNERVKIDGGKITIFNNEYTNGLTIGENYLPKDDTTSGQIDVKLKPDQYYVLGDNRMHSFDSRGWGPLPKGNLVGIVRLRLWPFSKLSVF